MPGAEVVLDGDQLSCVGLQLPRFPRWLAETHRNRITKIDVTGGALHNLSALEVCECLDTIIVSNASQCCVVVMSHSFVCECLDTIIVSNASQCCVVVMSHSDVW